MSEIELRHLGASGLLVSVLGIGCNNFGSRLDAPGATRVVHAALDAGVTFFDTADIYGDGVSEQILGAALQGRRDGAVIATKFGGPRGASAYRRGGSRRWIRIAVEESLRRLGTDWIDLYQMHFPDESTPIAETLETLDALVREGKVRYAGSSNFAAWQIGDAEWTARERELARMISAQNEYSLLQRSVELEVAAVCAQHGIAIIPFFPLAAGLLTGKYQRGEPAPENTRLGRVARLAQDLMTDRNFDLIDALQAFAAERSVSLLDVAIGGLAAQPQVASVITGAMTPEQVTANVAAAAWQPTPEDREELDRITADR